MRRLARLICLLRGHRPVDDRRDLFGRPMTCARCRLAAVAMSAGAHRRFLAAFERLHPHPVCAMGEGLALDVAGVGADAGGGGARGGPVTNFHGTAGGYSNHRCRCAACRAAWADACRTTRLGLAGRQVPRHGTENGYTNYGCRCEDCRAVHGAGNRRREQARREQARLEASHKKADPEALRKPGPATSPRGVDP